MYAQQKQLRWLHNRIKCWMLDQSKHEICNLLDIACGRGGDIQKWHARKIGTVVGLDVEACYVKEAKRRYAQLASTRGFDTNDYRFFVVAESENVPEFLYNNRLQHRYDVVTCHFAIHYFFESEAKIRELLRQVSELLYTGGTFMCTAMNADRVRALGPEFRNDVMILENSDTDAVFGAPVKIHLTGTLYFGECSFSSEYLVRSETLIALCSEYSLVKVSHIPFKAFQKQFETHLDANTAACSELYDCYIFERVK